MFNAITEDELLLISANTKARLEAYITTKKVTPHQTASLAGQILKDMGRPSNLIQDLIMMQTLKQLREDNKKGE